MPFLEIEPGIAIGSINNEKALRLRCEPDPSSTLTFVESADGSEVRVERALRHVDNLAEQRVHAWILNANQLNALGRFCVRQFMCGEPPELLSRIELSAKGAIMMLEAWNERARADEEHPPYDRIVSELRLIEGALVELRKGLTPT